VYKEIRLAGSGGQGLITAGVILAEAAIAGGHEAVQTQSYGPEARGGASRADVIISDEDILYPKARKFDIFLALTQEAYDKFRADLAPGGLLIIDGDLVDPAGDLDAKSVHITATVRKNFGDRMPPNVMALGVLQGLMPLVSERKLLETIKGRVPPKTVDKNVKAFKLGVKLGKALIDQPAAPSNEADL